MFSRAAQGARISHAAAAVESERRSVSCTLLQYPVINRTAAAHHHSAPTKNYQGVVLELEFLLPHVKLASARKYSYSYLGVSPLRSRVLLTFSTGRRDTKPNEQTVQSRRVIGNWSAFYVTQPKYYLTKSNQRNCSSNPIYLQ